MLKEMMKEKKMAKDKSREYNEIELIDLDEAPSRKELKQIKKEKKKEKKLKKKKNKEFAVVNYIFLFLFLCLAAYFCYFVQFKSEDFISSSYNPRLSAMYESVIRGKILTSDGYVVAVSTVDEEGKQKREYPYNNTYAHVVGYNVNGMAGVELDANFSLLRSHSDIFTRVKNEILGYKNQGDTVVMTVDSKLQSSAYKEMGGYRGAVVAIEPSTGKILAMVSKPDFNPNDVKANWESMIADDESSVLVNRATQGLYPPGSTFKIITALEYLREGGNASDEFNCKGSYKYEDKVIHCYGNKVHSTENFMKAFGKSCNCVFAEIGMSLDMNSYGELCDELLFNKKLPTELQGVKKSSFKVPNKSDYAAVMETAIGQGETLVTPMHMAMIASAIANDGVLMRPYVVSHVQNDDNVIMKEYAPIKYGELLSVEEASTMKEYMRYVVTDGTGTKLDVPEYTAYGKTGTAEFNSNKNDSHSWFVGFAENDGKQIAVAVIMEDAGSGSAFAVPLAKTMFNTYFAD